MTMEDPDLLLRRMRLGREEYVQRLLTMLILDGPYPKWNQSSAISGRGREFLTRLHELSFGTGVDLDGARFVDELDLPALTPDRAGGAPDWAVLLDDRIWIIELKTERASHRRGQLALYYELAAHHYPAHRIDITYLTGLGVVAEVDQPAGSRFAHTTWEEVLPLTQAVWSGAPTLYVDALDRVGQVLASLDEPWASWRGSRVEGDRVASTADATADALELARATAADGRQRALDHEVASLEELKELRVEVRQRLADDGVTGVSPWLWSAATTDGSPITEAGRRVGYELRVSRSRRS